MFDLLNFTIIFLISDMKPVVSLSSPDVFIQGDGYKEPMPYGPMEIRIDMGENIYIRESGDEHERIIKFDSTGIFAYTIDSLSIPSLDRISFGSMTIDPLSNDLIISGKGIPKDTNIDPRTVPSIKIKWYIFIFSSKGELLRTIASSFLTGRFVHDYEGSFYMDFEPDYVQFDNDFNYVKKINRSDVNMWGYSQWSNWIVAGVNVGIEYTVSDSRAGKFLIKLKNIKTKKLLSFSFFDPPQHSFGGYVEGQDRDGNIYLNIYHGYIRINPVTKKLAIVYPVALKIPSGGGDVGHGNAISPNGCIYIARLVRDELSNNLKYNIYRITPNLFQEKECEVKTQ